MSALDRLYSIAKDPLQLIGKGAQSIDSLSQKERDKLADRVVQFLNTNKTELFLHKDERQVQEAMDLLKQKCLILNTKQAKVVENFFSSYLQDNISQMPEEKLIEIFFHLDLDSLHALMRTSENMRRLAMDRDVWRKIAKQIGCELTDKDTTPIYERVREHILALRKEAAEFPEHPKYIEAILQQKPTIENSLRLSKLMLARDKEQIANTLLQKIDVDDLLVLENLSSDEERIAAADQKILTLTQKFASRLALLDRLNLSNLKLSSLPDIFTFLPALNELNLSGNQLKALPSSLCNLTHLTVIQLDDNKLQALPEQIGNLNELVQFHASGNQLKALPATFGQLTQLTVLNLSDNELQELPENIGSLTLLSRLHIRNNKLSELPETISDLESLTQLDVEKNQLKSLSENIGKLVALKRLYLTENQLQTLPRSIGTLEHLEELHFSDNPLKWLPRSLDNLTTTSFDMDLNAFERR